MKALQVVAVVVLLVLSCGGWVCPGDGHGVSRKDLAFELESSDARCGATFSKIAPCLVINASQCSNAEMMLQACVMWVLSNPSDLQPPPSCCSALTSVRRQYPMCFCLLTFYPPSAFNRSLQVEAPPRCNITADLCEECPPLLTALPTGVPFPTDSNCGTYILL